MFLLGTKSKPNAKHTQTGFYEIKEVFSENQKASYEWENILTYVAPNEILTSRVNYGTEKHELT